MEYFIYCFLEEAGLVPKLYLAVNACSLSLIQFGFNYMDYSKHSHWQSQHLLFLLDGADESMILPLCFPSSP